MNNWLELGPENGDESIWINFDHVAKVAFTGNKATVTTTKTAGQDRTFYENDNALKIKAFLASKLLQPDKKQPKIKMA